MGRWTRRLRRLVVGSLVAQLALLLVVALVLAWTTQTRSGRAVLLAQLVPVLESSVLDAELEIGAIERVFGTLVLSDVRIVGADGLELIDAARVEVEWRLRPLLARSVELPRILVVGRSLDVRVAEDGSLNVATLVRQSEPSEPRPDTPGWSVDLERIEARIDEGRFWTNADAPMATLGALDVRAGVRVSPSGVVDVEIPSLAAQASLLETLPEARRLALGGGTVRVTEVGLEVSVAELGFGSSALSALRLDMRPGEGVPFAWLSAAIGSIGLDPAELNPLLGGVELLAPLRASLVASGPVGALEFAVPVEGAGGAVELSGVLDLGDPASLGYDATVRAIRLVPSRWATLALDADISASVQVRGRGTDPDTAQLVVRVDGGPSRVEGIAVDELFAVVAYDAGAVDVRTLELRSGSATVRLDGSLAPGGAVEVELDVAAPDLSEVVTLLPGEVGTMSGSVDARIAMGGALGWDPLAGAAPPEDLEGLIAALGGVTGSGAIAVRRFDGFGAGVRSADVAWSADGRAGAPQLRLDLDAAGVVVGGTVVESASLAVGLERDRGSLSGRVAIEPDVRVELDVRGRLDGARLDLAIDALDAAAAGLGATLLEPTSASVVFGPRWSPQRVSLQETSLRVDEIAVLVAGSYAFDSGALRGSVRGRGLDLASIGARFAPDTELAGVADVHVTVSGTLRRPGATVDIGVTGLSAVGLTPHDLLLNASLDGDVLRLDSQLTRNGAVIASVATGEVGVPVEVDLERGVVRLREDRAIDVALSVERIKLGELSPVLPPSVDIATRGYIALVLELRGSVDRPEFVGSMRVNDATLEIPVGEESWAVERTSATLDLQVDGRGETWHIDVASSVDVGNRRMLDAQLRTLLDPERLGDDADAIADVVLDASVDISEFSVADLPGPIRESLGIAEGTFDALITWNGRVRDGVGSVSVVGNDVRVGALEPVSGRVDLWSGEQVRGEALAWYGAGSPHLSVGGPMPRAADGATGAELSFSVDTTLNRLFDPAFDGDVPVAARVVVPTVRFENLGSISSALAERRGGTNGYLDVFGTLADPVARGRIALHDVELLDGSPGGAGLELGYEGGVARAEVFICEGESRGVEFSASLGVDLGLDALAAGLPPVDTWPLRVEGHAESVDLAETIPLVVVAGLLDDVGGRLDLDFSVAGTVGRPEVRGTASLTEGRFGVIPLARTFENVRLRLEMSREAIQLTELVADDERGRLRGSGLVHLEDFAPTEVELQVRLRDFLVSSTSGAGAFLSGTTDVRVRPADSGLDVDVLLRGLVIDVPDDVGGAGGGPRALPEWVHFEGGDVGVDQRGARSPSLLAELDTEAVPTAPTRLDIRIRTGDRGVIHQQFAELEFTVDLAVLVDGDVLRVTGAVLVPEGVVRVAGKDFAVRVGRVSFAEGMTVVDPAIDVEAVHELPSSVTEYLAERGYVPGGDYATISVVVRGDLSDLAADPENAVRLVSDPRGLSEPDIFQLLASGRLSGDSDTEEGQQGVAAITSLLLGVVGDQLSGGIPIDTIRIESSGESQRVEGGKYIADNVYVSGTYIRSPNDEDDNNFEVALEWILRQIGPGSLRLELRGGDRGKGGLELLYNLVRGRRNAEEPQ